MHRARGFSFSFLGILLLIVFQNCGQEFRAVETATKSGVCKLTPEASSFRSSKLQLSKKFVSAQSKLSNGSMDVGLLVDVECLIALDQPLHFLGLAIELSPHQENLSQAAISLTIPTSTSHQFLRTELDQSECLIGLAEDIEIRKSSISSQVNDPRAVDQQHLDFVNASASLDVQSRITEKVVMAFVDSGIDYNHDELKNRMWRGPGGVFGVDIFNGDSDPMDGEGHGTHVAGIVAAEMNNSVNGTGLISGHFVQIMGVRVLDDNGAGTATHAHDGIVWAADNGADIINLSIEAPGSSPLLESAIDYAIGKGVFLVTVTGNHQEEITPSNLYAPAYIGESRQGLITVASVNSSDSRLSFFSGYSTRYAEMAAPGAQFADVNTGGLLSTKHNGGMTRILGTSQAAPIVSSAAAILIGTLKTHSVNYTPRDIEAFIKNFATQQNSLILGSVNNGSQIDFAGLSQEIDQQFSSSGSGGSGDGFTTGCP